MVNKIKNVEFNKVREIKFKTLNPNHFISFTSILLRSIVLRSEIAVFFLLLWVIEKQQ